MTKYWAAVGVGCGYKPGKGALFTEHLLRAKHYAKCFPCANAFNPHNARIHGLLLSPFFR